jgi:putative Flp pilus-assembly TadE/G-like protein
MKSFKYSERGQALVVIALAAIVLFGFLALAIDGSAKLSDRRHAQNAADTAVLAAALAKVTAQTDGLSDSPAECPPTSGPPSDVCAALLTAGLDRADSNSYDNNLTTNTVEVYSPPIIGYYTGDIDYVQVIITSHVKTYFAKIMGFAETTNVVQAVAYTKQGGELADGAMIISYDPSPSCSSGTGSGGGSVDISGSSTVNLNGGGILLNSDEVCGFAIPNCADLHIYGGGITSVGGVDNIDQDGCTTTAPEYLDPTSSIAIPDEVYFPDVPPECGQLASAYPDPNDNDIWYINPGYYTDFPQSNINGDIVGNRKQIIMNPGVYCVGGNIRWSGNTFDSLDGTSGVTIYLTSGNEFSLSINSPVALNASTSGDYQGYLIIQEGTHTSIQDCIINGGAYLDINGLIFAPYCDITVNGGSDPTAEINAQLIGWDIKINGTTTVNFNYDPSNQVLLKRKIGLMK